jgi:O-antigen ligase
MSGAFLGARLDDMSASGLNDQTRLLLSRAALHMIGDAPLQGLGLGTYQIAYPAYTQTIMPFIMDKAHNDYVELAAGWGLPAAILWWLALAWLTGLCVRGVLVRKRNRTYPMLAVGAVILVGVHSIFDFSLQIPAIAVTFVAILGLGVAQSFSARERAQWESAAPREGGEP